MLFGEIVYEVDEDFSFNIIENTGNDVYAEITSGKKNNETKSIPTRVNAILKCLTAGGGTPVFPKRNYKFVPVKE